MTAALIILAALWLCAIGIGVVTLFVRAIAALFVLPVLWMIAAIFGVGLVVVEALKVAFSCSSAGLSGRR